MAKTASPRFERPGHGGKTRRRPNHLATLTTRRRRGPRHGCRTGRGPDHPLTGPESRVRRNGDKAFIQGRNVIRSLCHLRACWGR